MKKQTYKNSIIYNQLLITKAIEEGHMNFIPVVKFPNKSIGEHIEIKYNQLYNEEFEKNYRNGTLEYYNHLIANFPKVTKKSSLLFTREWILKYIEEGLYIPNVHRKAWFSPGEILEQFYLNNQVKNMDSENKINLSNKDKKNYSRKKLK